MALQDAAQAYKVPYELMLAFLHGEADVLARAEADPVRRPEEVTDPRALPPAPFDDPVREAADRPYALAIWERFLDVPRRVAEPAGEQLFPDSDDDAKAWDGIGARLDIGDRVWFIADLRRRAAGRAPNSGAGTSA